MHQQSSCRIEKNGVYSNTDSRSFKEKCSRSCNEQFLPHYSCLLYNLTRLFCSYLILRGIFQHSHRVTQALTQVAVPIGILPVCLQDIPRSAGHSQLEACTGLSSREYLSSGVVFRKCSNKPSWKTALKLHSPICVTRELLQPAGSMPGKGSVDIGSQVEWFLSSPHNGRKAAAKHHVPTQGDFSAPMSVNHYGVTRGFSSHVPSSICFQTQETYCDSSFICYVKVSYKGTEQRQSDSYKHPCNSHPTI